jgi:hypothetical protein
MTAAPQPPSTSSKHAVPTQRVVPVRVDCPHCGGQIHIVTVINSETEPAVPQEKRSPSHEGELLNLLQRVAAFRRGSGGPSGTAVPIFGPQTRRRILAMLLAAVLVVAGVALVVWGRAPQAASVAPQEVANSTPVSSAPSGESAATRAALLDTIRGYNQAETEAAALLTIEPLLPFIDPTSPFAEQRAEQLALRRQQGKPHQTMLLRWGIGEITLQGTTATVVTQETWSNQEAGAIAAEEATVRVVYSLRRDAASGRWVIVESSQMPM